VELTGIGVSGGVAVGQALVVDHETAPVFRLLLPPDQLDAEVARLEKAVEQARRQLTAIRERLAREVGSPHGYIFDAHLLMLDDPLLLGRARTLIREEHVNADWSLRQVSEELHALFEGLSDEYLQERCSDVDDVLGRIHLNLRGAAGAPSLRNLPGSFVVVAAELTPSQAAELDWRNVQAVATDGGSATHHTSILARSFGVPAVVGLRDATRRIPPGTLVVVDGTRGLVVVEPSAPALASFRAVQAQAREVDQRRRATREVPSETRDHVRVRLLANAEFADEVANALTYGAEGLGLFRSEYLLTRSRQWPSEDRQVAVYAGLIETMSPRPVTVRLLDLERGDVGASGPSSPNPAMGQRALRLLDLGPEPYRTQVRALLRASAQGPLRIMLPFVTGPHDLEQALALVESCRGELRREGLPAGADVEVGIAVEVPSAALTIDLLAPQVDFVSVGTNDLIQYLLAVDRADPRVASFYEPLHPAVLRVLAGIVDAAGRAGVPLSVCGEMAADPLQALALVGLGVRELSMNPPAIPRVKGALRAIDVGHARGVVASCLERGRARDIESYLRTEFAEALGAAEHP
jgi:phosphotransferase system enzyme I (PtsI)